MSATSAVRRTARRVERSTALRALTRGGFIGYGLFHLAVAWLALQIALGHRAREGDQSGAFQVLADRPLGRFLLWLIIVGLLAMAVWQLLEALFGHRAERHRSFERAVSAGRTIVYTALAFTAYQVVSGAPTSSAQQQRRATAGMLAHPSGRFLVVLAGLAIITIGVGMIVYGWTRSYERRLRLAEMRPQTRRVVTRLAQVGYLAKGLAIGIVGVLIVSAAARRNAAQSTGLDGALRTLAGKPYGVFLLLVIAAGVAAFGVYCFFQSRYRKV